MRAIDKFQRFGQTIYNSQDVLKNHILYKYPIHLTDNTEDYSVVEQYKDEHDYVWIVDKNIETLREFPWWFKPTEPAIYLFPYVYKSSKRVKSWQKVQLVPTKIKTENKITKNFICGIYDVLQGKDNFDIFFGGNTDTEAWKKLKSRFPNAVAVKCLEDAQQLSSTDMFWIVPDDVIVSDFFKFSYIPDDWSHKFTHVFGNGNKETRDGIALFPKNYQPTEKEKQYRYYANKKELNIIASNPAPYDQFYLKTYQDYLNAIQTSKTDLFWFIPDDVVISEDFDFNLYFSHQEQFDRNINHVWLNDKNYDGIALFSKQSPVTEKEFNHRFYANKKEWDTVASIPKSFDYFEIDSFDEYLDAVNKSTTNMFWASSKNISVDRELIKTFYITHHDSVDRNQNHTFIHEVNNTQLYNGLFLLSKNKLLTEREIEHRFPAERKEWNIVGSKKKQYDQFIINNYQDYLNAKQNSSTEMFWGIPSDVDVDYDFDLYFEHQNFYDRNITHVFLNNNTYDGVVLFSKNNDLTEKEINHRFYITKKEWTEILSKPKPFDYFDIENYNDYITALEKSTTDLFWAGSKNISVNQDLIKTFYISHHDTVDRNQNHAFEHKVDADLLYNGLLLLSKKKILTEREVEHRFPAERKEWNLVGSGPAKYDVFEIDSYNDYLCALENSKTEMFWMSSRNIAATIPDVYFTHDNEYDRKQNHAFVHLVDDVKYYNGLFLCSKHATITEREIDYRHIVNRKEWNTVGSTKKQYDQFIINNYVDYFKAFEQSTTELFWGIPSDVDVKFDFDLYFTHDNEFDRKINHVMLNGEHRDGIVLFSKHSPVTEREIESRFYVNKKDWDVVASTPQQYEKFTVDTYHDYINAVEKSKTNMFWMIPPEVNVKPDFDFDLYFPHYEKFEREINHVYMNGSAYDGVSLISKKTFITEKEIKMRFFANKKQYNIVASEPTPYDIVFISNDEEHADENYLNLLERFPKAKRVHGVKGVHNAHIAAAELCSTDMIWIVDADAEIIPKFNFDYYVPAYDPDSRKTVHVWKAQNPINSLVYGYGAVKLLPREMTLNMDTSKPDMTTSISPYFKSINRISNITRFNTDPFSTWRSAFRETVKLASKSINGQLDEETDFRLNVWCTRGQDKPFGEYCIAGATAGKAYGLANTGNLTALKRINDFDWLKEQFDQTYLSV